MTIFGICITALYVLAIVFFRWESFGELRTIPLNELGDFLAGVFGPLTIFWLILGYVQQQKELQQNTKALELQANELKRSVEQHKELVKATYEQVQLDKDALELEIIREKKKDLPDISVVSARKTMGVGTTNHFEVQLKNSGKVASNVQPLFNPPLKQVPEHYIMDFLDTGDVRSIKWDDDKSGKMPKVLVLNILYTAADGSQHTKVYKLGINLDSYRFDVEQIS
ncbi:hypothetical protein [Vibrio rotiferianus]|uniref:hypothetical protein n=1 Tax=Vibrio rotiferianus TaxID=190895 RepID=UPI0009E2081F|nr:hypothetical protein [Vibrio rotiferianus]